VQPFALRWLPCPLSGTHLIEARADNADMDPKAYFEQLSEGLARTFGAPRRMPHGVRFGDIGLEYECIGSTMLVFLSTLNWMRYASWDGAVHIDMQRVSVDEAVRNVQEMMDLGRRRVGK
jgi:hypothetical protein